MNRTSIEWTDMSVNPIRARKMDGSNRTPGHFCQKISPGCANCYSSRMQVRFGMAPFPGVTRSPADMGEELFLDEGVLRSILRRKKPARIFWCDMTDLFGDWVPDEWIDRCFAVMALTPHLTHQVLTKRPERMADYMRGRDWSNAANWAHDTFIEPLEQALHLEGEIVPPLPNVWLGTSIENEATADERYGHLISTPAAVRFLSCEPLLGPIDLELSYSCPSCEGVGGGRNFSSVSLDDGAWNCDRCGGTGHAPFNFIHWVICGGESGPNARPMHPDWARSLRDQCQNAGVPYFFKQWGEWVPGQLVPHVGWKWQTADGNRAWQMPTRSIVVGTACDAERVGKKAAGRLLDGRTWDEYPSVKSVQSASSVIQTEAPHV